MIENSLSFKTKLINKHHLSSSVHLYNAPGNLNNLQQSKSSNNMHQQIQMHQQQQHNRLLHLQQQQHQQALNQQQQQQQQRLIMSHQMQMGGGLALHQSSHMPLVNSPSSGNILHVIIIEIFLKKIIMTFLNYSNLHHELSLHQSQ